MMWWFVILAFCMAAIVWTALALYLRVQRHMRIPEEIPRPETKTTKTD